MKRPPRPRRCCAARRPRFNYAKALATVGRLEEAEEAYAHAAANARGSEVGTYGKALAARQVLTQQEVSDAAVVSRTGGMEWLLDRRSVPAVTGNGQAPSLKRPPCLTCGLDVQGLTLNR